MARKTSIDRKLCDLIVELVADNPGITALAICNRVISALQEDKTIKIKPILVVDFHDELDNHLRHLLQVRTLVGMRVILPGESKEGNVAFFPQGTTLKIVEVG